MKRIFSNKWVRLVLFSALAIFLVVGIIIPLFNGIKRTHDGEIDQAVHDLITYPEIDKESVDKFVSKMDKAVNAGWKKESFDAQVLEGISKIYGGADSTSFARAIYEISAQQILLEAAGYENEEFKTAYEEQIVVLLDLQYKKLDFDDFVEALMEEPYPTMDQDEKVYDNTLSYYTFPKTYFLTEYLDSVVNDACSKSLDSKNGDDLMKLCYELSVLCEYSEFDINDFADMNKIISTLKADAETIIVKEGEGGFYDGKTDSTTQDNQGDELFDQVAGAIAGTDVHSNKQKFSQTKYYGDLKSYYFESGLHYSYTDEEGKTQHGGNSSATRKVYLKDELIYSSDTVDEKHLKEAYADGMVNYHKDGNCYGISDSAIVCYVGDYIFLLDFSK